MWVSRLCFVGDFSKKGYEMNKYYSSMSMMVALAALLILSVTDNARAETSEKTGPPIRVIYNLDCSEFFVGTFGPVVPETIDKWVDAHAAANRRVRW